MVSPPQSGDDSYAQFIEEKTAIQNELRAKAQIIGIELNQIDGISVNHPEGAMYAFVKFELPEAMLQNSGNVPIDEKYCLALLEETGICVVPGSGFGQLPNTLHFRTTFLPPREQIVDLVAELAKFHHKHIQQ
jgi:alanine transaminase